MIKVTQVFKGQLIAEEGKILDTKRVMIVLKGSIQVLKCLGDLPKKELNPADYNIRVVEHDTLHEP